MVPPKKVLNKVCLQVYVWSQIQVLKEAGGGGGGGICP